MPVAKLVLVEPMSVPPPERDRMRSKVRAALHQFGLDEIRDDTPPRVVIVVTTEPGTEPESPLPTYVLAFNLPRVGLQGAPMTPGVASSRYDASGHRVYSSVRGGLTGAIERLEEFLYEEIVVPDGLDQ